MASKVIFVAFLVVGFVGLATLASSAPVSEEQPCPGNMTLNECLNCCRQHHFSTTHWTVAGECTCFDPRKASIERVIVSHKPIVSTEIDELSRSKVFSEIPKIGEEAMKEPQDGPCKDAKTSEECSACCAKNGYFVSMFSPGDCQCY